MYKVTSIAILCVLLSVAVAARERVMITSGYTASTKGFNSWHYDWVGTIAPSVDKEKITPGMIIPIDSIVDSIVEHVASDSPVVDAGELWIDFDCAGHPIDLFIIYDQQGNFVGISITPEGKISESHGKELRENGSTVVEKGVVLGRKLLSGIGHFFTATERCLKNAEAIGRCYNYLVDNDTAINIVDTLREFACGGG